MAFTPITGFTIIWDNDDTPGEVKLNLDEDPDIETKWKVFTVTDAAAWATLLSAGTIAGALQAYEEGLVAGRCDSLFTVNKFQTRFYRADASPVNHDPKNLIRTQDLEPWFEENSNLYIFNHNSFAATRARIGLRPMLFETPRIESADIDDQEGWDIAETIAQSRRPVSA